MSDLFNNGILVDLILLLVLLEALILVAYWWATKRGIPPSALFPNLFAGGFLLLTLRAVIGGDGWETASLFLAGAGLSHVIDLYRRWNNAGKANNDRV